MAVALELGKATASLRRRCSGGVQTSPAGVEMALQLLALAFVWKVSEVQVCITARVCGCRIQELLAGASPDPSMAGALPPGAWWDYVNSNTAMPVDKQPYGPDAGDAAVQAAHDGNLRLQDVSFAYPLRPNSGGETVIADSSCCQIQSFTDH
jgi:hypothetical protein